MSTTTPIATPRLPALARLAPLILLALCLLLGWLAWHVTRTQWVAVIEQPQAENRASQLQQRIQTIERGERIPIARFRTDLGKHVLISVMEGRFDGNAGLAPPSDAWRTADWTNAILINSVDENQSISGGMSGSVILGCMTRDQAAKLSKLAAGDSSIQSCTQKLREEFRVKRIANVAVVTWKSYTDKAPCYDATREGQQEKYLACIEETVRAGLARTFDDIRATKSPPDAIIIPALGTGVGALPKHAFYRALQGVILTNLNNAPANELVMHVWKDDSSHRAASFSLSRAITDLESTWRKRPAPNADLLIILAGVFGGLFLATTSMQISGRLLAFRSAPYVAGWAASAFGAATGVQKLIIDQIGETLPYLNQAPALFAAGIVGVLICGPLMRAIESYKTTDP